VNGFSQGVNLRMGLTRREFLKAGLVGAGGACLSGALGRLLSAAPEAATPATSAAPQEAARVFQIDEPRLLDDFGNVRVLDYLPGVVRKLLRSMMGTNQARNAWRQLFSKQDVIGVKLDPLAADELRVAAPLARVLLEELRDAGFEADRIILIDSPIHIKESRTREPPFGYEERPIKVGTRQTHLARALSAVTALLNVPTLKDHRTLGLACGMSNLGLGLVSNPGKFLDSGGDPGLAELCAHEAFRSRHRLTLVNAIRGIYDGGPRTADKVWSQGTLVASTDLVAADRVALDILDAARISRGLRTLADDGRPAKYLQTAERLGLGQANLARIALRRVSI